MASGYYRFPTISKDTVIFVCEDDLWSVPVSGGVARRLTSNLGEVTRPFLSPDGTQLAFVGREDGQPEIYVMPALGGQTKRLTYLGGSLCQTTGWTQDGKIIFANNVAQPFGSLLNLYTVDTQGNPPEPIRIGPARAISYGPNGRMVIGRNTGDPARWKRYRGGTAGQIWIDEKGDGIFRPLIQLKGNLASPIWIGERIYFLSDHEGIGNLYSCLPSGEDLHRHTDHADFYARNATSDGLRIVYHSGADLFVYDPVVDKTQPIQVGFHSPQVQRSRKFVNPSRYLEVCNIHPKGQSLAITARGKAFSFANWEGAVMQHGAIDGVRIREPNWLNDGKRLVAITDEGGEESFVIFHADGSKPPEVLPKMDAGRAQNMAVNPKKDQVVFDNHRQEIMLLDLATQELRMIDSGVAGPSGGYDWSPDGEWVAYSISVSLQVMALKLWKAATGEVFPLTEPVLRDVAPSFDPDGKYIYFLSFRYFDPVYDNLQFDLNFPRGMKPCLITLQKDALSPFIPQPKSEEKDGDKKDKKDKKKGAGAEEGKKEEAKEKKAEEKPVQIDLEGIQRRIVTFPVEEGRYGRIMGLKEGKVLYSDYPVEGTLNRPFFQLEPPAKGILKIYTFEDQKEDVLISGITYFDLSCDRTMLLYRAGNRVRVIKAGEKPDKENSEHNRKSGWIDLDRVKLAVTPMAEWRQMFREAWRLQRDHFWTPDMSKIDWVAVHDRYLPLVERVSSRSEFSDLMWEMQGELGTSHCYEFGGDYRPEPDYHNGYLAAEFTYEAEGDCWKISSIARGDAWDEKVDSPLNRPGVNIKDGDRLAAINGRRLSRDLSPAKALVNQAGNEVILTFVAEGENPPRNVTVKTLSSESPVYFRQWVEANRKRVHEATHGRVGYVHIPDMSAYGYAEFHRGYLAEVDREGLLVDLRFNGGGNVSSRLLEKLARRRIGYDSSRWFKLPMPYPPESVLGPMVALTNEFAGSDGDMFSHGFKLMKLGPLIGKRTWGGVIGIWPRHALVDGTLTTQPEFSFWFTDVGWGIENYGTDPDIEVDITPQDYMRGVDVQLERSIQELLRLLEANPPRLPDFKDKPDLSLPVLPPR